MVYSPDRTRCQICTKEVTLGAACQHQLACHALQVHQHLCDQLAAFLLHSP